ncbi:MAG: HDOD domain-containing protein [Spirochaetes bacterium]|nr:HDOD domain-containing protein [Spirochaetota bacterium]
MGDRYLDRIRDLPVMPEVAAKVINLTEGKLEISFKELEAIIKVDPGLTAKILKIANSALYARQREIKSLQMAIMLLGFKNIKSLVLLITASNLFPRMRISVFHKTYWKHGILSAFISKSLAVRCGRSEAAEEAFIAGLLHDIGQAALFTAAPAEYGQALEAEKLGALLLETIEEQMFNVNHRQIGGALLKKWNFPVPFVDVALEHESLNITSVHKSFVILVSVACMLAEWLEAGALPPLKEDLFQQLLPYTCLGAADVPALTATYSAELRQDRLFQEYQVLFDLA